jgi:hypothetical protein
MGPDPGGPKTYESYGSVSATLPALKVSTDRYLASLYDGEIVELSKARAHPAAYSRGAEQQAGRHHPLQLGEGGLLGQLRHFLPRLTILIPGQPVIHQPLQNGKICLRFMRGAKSFNFVPTQHFK